MILNDKDSTTRIENVRYLRKKKDPPVATVLMRPLRDLEERTNDVWDIMDPAKQFYVHESTPAGYSVKVEAGWIFNEQDSGTDADPTYFSGQSVVVSACAPNKIRMDLVYFDRSTNQIRVVLGTEVQESTGWSSLWDDATPLRATLPTGHVNYAPLAYLYVGSRPSETLQDSILLDNAGHIRDCRIGSHVNWNLTGSASEMKTDTPGGSGGTIQKAIYSDHQHPVNVPTSGSSGSSSVTAQLSALSPRDPGNEDSYSRSDHTHNIIVSATAADLVKDFSGTSQGAVGSSPSLCRSDHRHPMKFRDASDPSSLPGDLDTALGAYVGTGTDYARHDHRHWLTGDVFMAVSAQEIKWYEWSATYSKWKGENSTKSTGAFSVRPLFAITMCAGKFYSASAGWTNWRDNPGYQSWGWVLEGNPPSSQYSIGVQDYWDAGVSWWGSSRQSGAAAHISNPGIGYSTSISQELNCTYLGQPGATYSISSGDWHGYLSTIAFGFISVSP